MEWRREGRTEAGVDHEKLHGGAYGRAADGDLQVPPRKPHTALLTASFCIHKVRSTVHQLNGRGEIAGTCQESEERSPGRGGGGGGGGSRHELTDRGEGEEEVAGCYGPVPKGPTKTANLSATED